VTSAAGVGLATVAAGGTVLDTWFPAPEIGTANDEPGTVRLSVAEVPGELAGLSGRDDDRDVETVLVRTVIGTLADPPKDAYDAYLRLHLLSHRLIKPHEANVDGIFGVLTNVVWTNHGPCAVEGFETVRARLRRRGPVTVYGVDKFPRMVDYVIHRCAGRRRRPGTSRRTPRARYDGHARGLRELQRGHARRVDGRGSNLGGRRGR
jgi:2,3,4,5-tetrahydropyridine-2,6-dicarboxylate N-succinyltransferase